MQWDNAEALQQLVDMGFPENRARKALQIHRGHAQLGMDWLLEHEGDADIDEPLSQDHLRHLRQAREDRDGSADQAAVQRLIEMGFSEDDIVVALEHCHHDFDAATAWLLGDRGEGGMEDDGEMFSASASGSMLDSLMNEPQLQQALANPRVVTALQGIMEHPESAIDHLDDPEVARILQVLGMAGQRPQGLDPLDDSAGI